MDSSSCALPRVGACSGQRVLLTRSMCVCLCAHALVVIVNKQEQNRVHHVFVSVVCVTSAGRRRTFFFFCSAGQVTVIKEKKEKKKCGLLFKIVLSLEGDPLP